jgi:uncharacterized protein YjbJ (UPF0337 family)
VDRKSSAQDKSEGAVDKAKGRIKEAAGALTSDETKKSEGRADQNRGVPLKRRRASSKTSSSRRGSAPREG